MCKVLFRLDFRKSNCEILIISSLTVVMLIIFKPQLRQETVLPVRQYPKTFKFTEIILARKAPNKHRFHHCARHGWPKSKQTLGLASNMFLGYPWVTCVNWSPFCFVYDKGVGHFDTHPKGCRMLQAKELEQDTKSQWNQVAVPAGKLWLNHGASTILCKHLKVWGKHPGTLVFNLESEGRMLNHPV